MHGELQGVVFTSEITAMLVLAVPFFAICLCETAFCFLTIISVLLPLFSLDAECEAMSLLVVHQQHLPREGGSCFVGLALPVRAERCTSASL